MMMRSLDEDELDGTTSSLPLVAEVGPLASLILPRITATLSALAVICVFAESGRELWLTNSNSNRHGISSTRSTKAARNTAAIHHIQFFYQIPLFCFSFANALGTLPAPSSYEEVWGAVGSITSCTAVGAINQFGLIGTLGWDAALSFTYLQMARQLFRGQQEEESVERLLLWYHLIIWPLTITATLLPLPLTNYNFHYSACWLGKYPDACEGDECIRGETAPIWMASVSLGGLVHLFYSVTIMVLLYRWIRKLETKKQKEKEERKQKMILHSGESISGTTITSSVATPSSSQGSLSRPILVQGCLYSSGMVLVILPTAVNVALFNLVGIWSPGMAVVAQTFTPLVGWVNFCVYMRNKSPQDCHFGYSRILRKAHGWLLDYDFTTLRFNCCCYYRCRRKNTSTNQQETAEITDNEDHHKKHRIGANDNDTPAEGQAKKLSAANGGDDNTQSEKDNHWFSITVEKRRPEQYTITSEVTLGSEFDHGLDNAPAMPRRVLSGSEQPPLCPQRVITCSMESLTNETFSSITEDSESGMLYVMHASSSGQTNKSHSIQQPPRRPERLLTELETHVEVEEEEEEEDYDEKVRHLKEEQDDETSGELYVFRNIFGQPVSYKLKKKSPVADAVNPPEEGTNPPCLGERGSTQTPSPVAAAAQPPLQRQDSTPPSELVAAAQPPPQRKGSIKTTKPVAAAPSPLPQQKGSIQTLKPVAAAQSPPQQEGSTPTPKPLAAAAPSPPPQQESSFLGREIEQLHQLAKLFKVQTTGSSKQQVKEEEKQSSLMKPPPSQVAIQSEFSNVSSIYTMPEMYHGKRLYPKIIDDDNNNCADPYGPELLRHKSAPQRLERDYET